MGDYADGAAWGRTEGVRAIPGGVAPRDDDDSRYYARSAYAQCIEAGMSRDFARGASGAVRRATSRIYNDLR